MSSDLFSALEGMKMNDYASLAIITTVVYDYLLTFSSEVEYVWQKPWSWVSALFMLVRYLGLSLAVFAGLYGSTFVTGPTKMLLEKGTMFYVISQWQNAIFYNATDLLMILRVYATWGRSKRVLWILLSVFVLRVISLFIIVGIYENLDTYTSVTVVQLLNISFCNDSSNFQYLPIYLYSSIPEYVLTAELLLLIVIQPLKQSIEMYRATKRWYVNRYIQQLLRHGILYFFLIMFYEATVIVANVNTSLSNSNLLLFLNTVSYATLIATTPRFIIDVRKMFERDLRGAVKGLDTGFGAMSQLTASQNIVSAIAFADVPPEQDQAEEEDANESQGIRLEALGDSSLLV